MPYTISQILTAAGIQSGPTTSGGVTVQQTAGGLLIDTHERLRQFVTANPGEFPPGEFEAHHIFESLDLFRTGLAELAPAVGQQICVLLPASTHDSITDTLRSQNPVRLSVDAAQLVRAYRQAYLTNPVFLTGTIRRELFSIFQAVLRNLTEARTAAQLASAQSQLTTLENNINLERKWHQDFIQEAPSLLERAAFTAAATTPGLLPLALLHPRSPAVMVAIANPAKLPPLSIWEQALDEVRTAKAALSLGDPVAAVIAIGHGQAHFRKALDQFLKFRDGIQLGGHIATAAIVIGALTAIGVLVHDYKVVLRGPRLVMPVAESAAGSASTQAVQTATERVRIQLLHEGESALEKIRVGATEELEEVGKREFEEVVKKVMKAGTETR
jgi:hypothetical protein